MSESCILDTLRFFHALNIAPSFLELQRYQAADKECASFVFGGELLKVLHNLQAQGRIAFVYGYYALPGKQELCVARMLGYGASIVREQRIRRTLWVLNFLPFVRGVALAGSQALGLPRKESDIDLLIITEPGWLWLPRTIVTAYFQLLGIRRHGAQVANRVCLNHYIAGYKSITHSHNVYTAFEYAKLRPLVGEHAIRLFQYANMEWISTFFSHVKVDLIPAQSQYLLQQILERIFTALGGEQLEHVLGVWQAKRIKKDQKEIIVEADELSFHPDSKQDKVLAVLSGN